MPTTLNFKIFAKKSIYISQKNNTNGIIIAPAKCVKYLRIHLDRKLRIQDEFISLLRKMASSIETTDTSKECRSMAISQSWLISVFKITNPPNYCIDLLIQSLNEHLFKWCRAVNAESTIFKSCIGILMSRNSQGLPSLDFHGFSKLNLPRNWRIDFLHQGLDISQDVKRHSTLNLGCFIGSDLSETETVKKISWKSLFSIFKLNFVGNYRLDFF